MTDLGLENVAAYRQRGDPALKPLEDGPVNQRRFCIITQSQFLADEHARLEVIAKAAADAELARAERTKMKADKAANDAAKAVAKEQKRKEDEAAMAAAAALPPVRRKYHTTWHYDRK